MRQGLKLLVLAALTALSLMAVSVSAAQAAGEFRIGTPLKTFAAAGVGSRAFTGTVNSGHLLAEGLNIGCAGGTGSGTAVKGGTGTASATFTGCFVKGSEKFCKVYSGLTKDKDVTTLTGEGEIKASGEGKLLLHPESEKPNQKHYLLVEGLEKGKKPFTLFDVWGKLCPLSTSTEALHNEVTGSTVIALPDALSDLVNHEIQSLTLETLKELFPLDILKLGQNEAHFGEGTGAGGVVTGSLHLIPLEKEEKEEKLIWGAE